MSYYREINTYNNNFEQQQQQLDFIQQQQQQYQQRQISLVTNGSKRQRIASSSSSTTGNDASTIINYPKTKETPSLDSNNNNNNNNNINKPISTNIVHARNLSEITTENDLYQSLERYGKINNVILMPKKRQALIEFSDLNGAINCICEANKTCIFIAGSSVYLNYSTNRKLLKTSSDDDINNENHILLFTILNPLYPITVDVMHTICSSVNGKVNRIVIFRKNGVQAMIEFDSVDTAKRAKQQLNGADIYSGCCTLKIEYAKPTKLNVIKNDQDSWDYTIDDHDPLRKQPLLQTPYYTHMKQSPYGITTSSGVQQTTTPTTPKTTQYLGSDYPQQQQHDVDDTHYTDYTIPSTNTPLSHYFKPVSNNQKSYSSNYNNNSPLFGRNAAAHSSRNLTSTISIATTNSIPSLMSNTAAAAADTSSYLQQQTVDLTTNNPGQLVLMVYNLCPQKFNCDRLFNLFCLYGNIDRIKFLVSKEGSAMIQMSNADIVFNFLTHLNNTYVFGKKLQISISNQNVLNPVARPKDLADGTPSYKDYFGNRNNRYQNAEAANKNKPLAPANVCHWFNAPPNINEQQIIDIFIAHNAKKPAKIKVFPKKSDKSSTGLVEWNNIADCVEALVLVNHAEVTHSSSKFPYVFKLCFSATPIIDTNNKI